MIADHGRWGFRKCYDRMRLDGHRWNHKKVHRVYCALRLTLPRARDGVPPRFRQTLVAPTRLNDVWAIDFMHDAVYGGRRFRTLNVLDEGNREGLAIEVGTSIPATRVIRVLSQLVALYGRPDRLRLDNGPELTSEALTSGGPDFFVALSRSPRSPRREPVPPSNRPEPPFATHLLKLRRGEHWTHTGNQRLRRRVRECATAPVRWFDRSDDHNHEETVRSCRERLGLVFRNALQRLVADNSSAYNYADSC